MEQNLNDEENKKKCDDLSHSTEHEMSSTTNKIQQQATYQLETNTAETAGTANMHHGVPSKQDLCSEVSNSQINIRSGASFASDYSEDTRTISSSKLSSCDTEISKPDDTSKVLSTSRHSNDDTETSTQGVQECEVSTPPRDNSVKLIVNSSRGVFKQQDLLIPWHYRREKSTNSNKNSNKRLVDHDEQKLNSSAEERARDVYQRFYHVFKENELAEECRKFNNISVVRCYYDKGNWCVELEKVKE